MSKLITHLMALIVGIVATIGGQTLTKPKPDEFKDRCWGFIHTCLVNQEFYKGTELEQEFSMVGQQFIVALEKRNETYFDEAWVNLCNIQEPEMTKADLERLKDAEQTVQSKLSH